MNSVKITQTLQQALVDYLMTTFDPNKDGSEPELALKIREGFEQSKALFTGPYLEMIHPYKHGKSLRELHEEGILSSKLLDLACFKLEKPEPIPPDALLYLHQELALRKLCAENKSIVVSAGTGSGKTEAFSIPIINDLLEDNTPGVRALLVYPLNALVNDQMERLRVLLKGTDITFGRFTSELPNTADRDKDTLPNEIISRDEIRSQGRIPQILITNYAMLEYLLIRPEDSPLFSSGLWKFLVLDEAHTYTGAQGIEVAMLIRRLKQRLSKKPGELLCIATSATLVNDDPKAAADFAESLFGENIQPEDVIFGEEEKVSSNGSRIASFDIDPWVFLHDDFESMLAEMRKEPIESSTGKIGGPNIEMIAIWLIEVGLANDDILEKVSLFADDLPGFLFSVLKQNKQVIALREWMIEKNQPVPFDDAAFAIFPTFDEEDRLKALNHLVEITSIARPSNNQLSLIPAKYHIFARTSQGIWACVNPNCEGRNRFSSPKWSKIFSIPTKTCDSCGSVVYPVYLCRECGQPYLVCHFNRETNEYFPATDRKQENLKSRYFTWKPIDENTALAESSDGEDEEQQAATSAFGNDPMTICLACCKPTRLCTCVQKGLNSIELLQIKEITTKTKNGKGQTHETPLEMMNECPRCRHKAKKDTEVITPVKILGTGPLANLTYELYRQLPTANDEKRKRLPGEGRKLLSFYDSRQGAARFAAFVQDVKTTQNYQQLIPIAIEACNQADEWGEPSLPGIITLSKKSAGMAWNYGLLKTDVDLIENRGGSFQITNDKQKENAQWLARVILAEFTTGRRSRQSLESMGLAGVRYFHTSNRPDISPLSSAIGLSDEQTLQLIENLLDDLRYHKSILLPSGIEANDPIFGANKANPKLIKQGHQGYCQLWIGKTSRQARRRTISSLLKRYSLPATDSQVEYVLGEIWDWLINNELLIGSATDGYLINTSKIVFDTEFTWYRCSKCRRLSYRGNNLPCSHAYCDGELEEIEIDKQQSANYFYNAYKQAIVPIRIEEHTAQLDPEKGKEYQDKFKEGYITALSCSTTFEMGIDLGDLQAVVMSNVPPSVSNYRQRSGRAGRRASGTAYILTWANGRPHDQAYYDDPVEIISGNVPVPNIMLENEQIIRRHVNALLLSQFLRDRKNDDPEAGYTYNKEFFGPNTDLPPHYDHLLDWAISQKSKINALLQAYSKTLPVEVRSIVINGLANFLTDLKRLRDDNYMPITDYYREQIRSLGEKIMQVPEDIKDLNNQVSYFQSLLARMEGAKGKKTGFLIDYLSNKGILPSYSFPLHTVELTLPKVFGNHQLRLERDLRQAIKEYAPGAEIVADKKVWKVDRPIFYKDSPAVFEYRMCDVCHNLEISAAAGMQITRSQTNCEICGVPFGGKSKIRKFVEPDGFLADKNSGKPAKQYVEADQGQMRSALIPEQTIDEEETQKFLRLSYNQHGQLLYVNEGRFGIGYKFDLSAFNLFGTQKDNIRYSLGHIQTTNDLHIRFVGYEMINIPSPDDQSFWLSLMYAIINGACKALQIERRDIDGVLFPRKVESSWAQSIVLYDNVPGGAGHVKRIMENIIDVLHEAIRILNCDDCAPDTSCYHCLRDYNNQYFHQDLRRDKARDFLELILASLSDSEYDLPGVIRVISSNPARWLLEKIRYSKKSISIALDELNEGHPDGGFITWLDTIGDQINAGKQVELFVKKMPEKNAIGLSLSNHLSVLIEKGLKISKVDQLPEWQIIIDADHPDQRIIGSDINSASIHLSNTVINGFLITSTDSKAMIEAKNEWRMLRKLPISLKELAPPENTKVISIRNMSNAGDIEQQTFGEFFKKPVTNMIINDPYLNNWERITKRLSRIIDMASKNGTLEKVTVKAKPHEDQPIQKEAQNRINQIYGGIIRFEQSNEHDRYIEITRIDGQKAIAYIGRGLDYIQPDNSVRSTYIIIQDPVQI